MMTSFSGIPGLGPGTCFLTSTINLVTTRGDLSLLNSLPLPSPTTHSNSRDRSAPLLYEQPSNLSHRPPIGGIELTILYNDTIDTMSENFTGGSYFNTNRIYVILYCDAMDIFNV